MSATAHIGGWSPKLCVNCQPTRGMLAGLEKETRKGVAGDQRWKGNKGSTEKRQGGNTGRESWRGAEGRDGEGRGGSQRPGDSEGLQSRSTFHSPLPSHQPENGNTMEQERSRHVKYRALSTRNYRSVSARLPCPPSPPQPPPSSNLASPRQAHQLQAQESGGRERGVLYPNHVLDF